MGIIRLKSIFIENPAIGKSAGSGLNLPKYSITNQKIDIDNNASFDYEVGYWCRLTDVSIGGGALSRRHS